MKCPRCNYSNQGNVKFCANCGAPLANCNAINNHSSDVPTKKSFWKKPWFVVLMCIFIPPLGIALLLISKKPKHPIARILLTIILALYSIFWIAFVAVCIDDEQENRTENSQTVSDSKEDSKKAKPKKNEFESGIQKYESGEYSYITQEDLNKYHANMKGVKVYCVIEIDDIKEERVQSTITDGFMMSDFNVVEDYKNIENDDIVAVLGEIGDYDDYGGLGKSIDLNNCYIFAKGKDAKSYDLGKSDEKLSQYFVATEEVANSNADLSEDEFKNLCATFNYEDIIRNPDSYEDRYCKLSGSVSQVVEGLFDSYTLYINDYNGNTWGCTYSYKDGESHLLEGDNVNFYGILNGTKTTKTVLGKQVTVPYLEVEYIK